MAFYKRSDGMLVGYKAQGHSDYADAGSDIVCAAVSALTQATANGITKILKAPARYSQNDRDAVLELRLSDACSDDLVDRAQLLFETLLQAVQSIQADFPQNVRVIFKEWR